MPLLPLLLVGGTDGVALGLAGGGGVGPGLAESGTVEGRERRQEVKARQKLILIYSTHTLTHPYA